MCQIHYTVSAEICRIQANGRYKVGWIPLIGRPGEWLCNQAADYASNPVLDFPTGEEKRWDWWLHMDCDNPPRRDPLELIELDLPLVILPTPMVNPHREEWGRVTSWNVWPDRPGSASDEWTQDTMLGLQRIRWGGAGCFLARCRDVEKLARPLFAWRFADKEQTRMASSPDAMFCKRWTDAGYPIHTHWDYPCNHWRDNLNLWRVATVEDELAALKADREAETLGANAAYSWPSG